MNPTRIFSFLAVILLQISLCNSNPFMKRGETREFINSKGEITQIRRSASDEEKDVFGRSCKCRCKKKGFNEWFCCECSESVCFPSAATVQTAEGKTKQMSDLSVGDLVLSVSDDGSLIYSEVRTFLKKQPDTISTYLSVTTSSNNIISLSGSHLIYTKKTAFEDFTPIYADHVGVGDEVLIPGNDGMTPTKVTNITSEIMQGAYVPLTMEGTIIVDGVLASCYASFDHYWAHAAMTPIRWFPGLVEWLFGEDNGSLGYVDLVGDLGRWVLPYGLQNKKPKFFDLYQSFFPTS